MAKGAAGKKDAAAAAAAAALEAAGRPADAEYPKRVHEGDYAKEFARNLPAPLLPEWGSGAKEEAGAAEAAGAPAIVGKIQHARFEGCEWRTAGEVWPEACLSTTGADGGEGPDRKRLQISELFAETVWDANLARFASYAEVSNWVASSIEPGRLLAECIEARGECPAPLGRAEDESGEDGALAGPVPKLYAVGVFLDGELREILVNDQIPVDADTGKALCPCSVRVLQAPPEATETQAGEEKEGGQQQQEQAERREVCVWPAILYKALLWLAEATHHGSAKTWPFAAINKWVLSSTRPARQLQDENASAFPACESTPTDIAWDKLVVPRHDDFFFSSWEHFTHAKAKAVEVGDESILALYEQAEREAIEKKAQYEQAQAEAEMQAQAPPDGTEDGTEGATENSNGASEAAAAAAAVTVSKPKPRKGNKKKKKKKKGARKDFIPFNQVSFDAAMAHHAEAKAHALEALGKRRASLDIIRIGPEPLIVPCSFTSLEELSKPPPSAAAHTQPGTDAETPKDGAPLEPGEKEAETAPPSPEEDMLLRLGNAVWQTEPRALLSHASYAVAEVSDGRLRLVGLVGTAAGAPDWSLAHTLWISFRDLLKAACKSNDEAAGQAAFELRTWTIPEAGLPSTTLHDHWKRSEIAPAEADEAQASEDTTPPTTHWSRSHKSNGFALVFKSSDVESTEEAPRPTAIPVTLQLSFDASQSECISRSVLKVAQVTETISPETDLMRCLTMRADGNGDNTWQISCRSSEGLATCSISLDPTALYMVALDAPLGGAVRVLSHSATHVPEFIPCLEALARSLEGSETPAKVETLRGELRPTPAGDWQIAARYRLRPSNPEGGPEGTISAMIQLDDAQLGKHVQALVVRNSTGRGRRVDSGPWQHNGQWVAPLQLSTVDSAALSAEAGEAQAAETFDLLIIVHAPPHHALRPSGFTIQLLAAQALLQGVDTLADLKPERFRGEYLANKGRILFRDYIIASPEAASLRLCVPGRDVAYRLQVIVQDPAAQAQSTRPGFGDVLVAEVRSEKLEGGCNVADLHALPAAATSARDATPGSKIILQAVLEEGSNVPTSRAPYWDPEQLPSDPEAPDDEQKGSNQAGEGGTDALAWTLLTVSAGGHALGLSRETAWESAVSQVHTDWETETPTCLVEGLKLRSKFVRCPFFPQLEPDDSDLTNRADGSDGGAGAADSTGSSDSPKRNQIRQRARFRMRGHLDPRGQLLLPRCPKPRNEADAEFLDAMQARVAKKLEGVPSEAQEEQVALLHASSLFSEEARQSTAAELLAWHAGAQTDHEGRLARALPSSDGA